MAIPFSFSLLLLMALTATITSAAESPAPSQSPSSPEILPPPPSPPAIQEKQLRNILDALIGAGDYGGWANLLSSANPSSLPLTATLFVPCNDAISHLLSAAAGGAQLDPNLLQYHIIPQRLSFSDLQRFPTLTRLPTLLPHNFIVVTDNSPANFTVDESQILQADIFLNAAFAMHGVDKVLNYSVFGGGGPFSPPPMSPENASLMRRKRNPTVITGGVKSGARRSCSGILVTLLSLLMFFKFKNF